MEFRLQKWYMDCVAHDGEARILYCAKLSIRGLSREYSSVLSAARDGAIDESFTFRSNSQPVSVHPISWKSERLHVTASWEPLEAGFSNCFDGGQHSPVVWTCLSPRAKASVVHNNYTIEGDGYVEYLDLRADPAKLGITELRWGRFIGKRSSIVWIEWRGAHPITAIYVNGIQSEKGTISLDRVTAGNASLALTDHSVLREGPLVRTVLGPIPGLHHLLRGLSLNIDEYKLRSRGHFASGAIRDEGWAIHEVVKWT